MGEGRDAHDRSADYRFCVLKLARCLERLAVGALIWIWVSALLGIITPAPSPPADTYIPLRQGAFGALRHT